MVLIVPLVLLFAGGSDDPAAAGGLRVERSDTVSELIVSVDPEANTAARAGGARSVTLRCVDSDGQLVVAGDQAWPFTDTDGDTQNPHTHMPLDPVQQDLVSSCRLIGTDPQLEGEVP
jgi:hypothetical protein